MGLLDILAPGSSSGPAPQIAQAVGNKIGLPLFAPHVPADPSAKPNPPSIFELIGAHMLNSYGNAALNAVTYPGHLLQSTTPVTTDEMIGPALNFASMLTLGAGVVPAEANALRAGASGFVRKLPSDNYLGPVSRYAKSLYREMSPGDAIVDLPTSIAHSGTPFGNRRFYADTPDLAIGQGGNRGVKVEYDPSPFEGTINKKPGWEIPFQNGSAEYIAEPRVGENIRDAVRGFEIDPSALSKTETAQYERILKNLEPLGWSVDRSGPTIKVKAPVNNTI